VFVITKPERISLRIIHVPESCKSNGGIQLTR
jgi:hypothetical protein